MQLSASLILLQCLHSMVDGWKTGWLGYRVVAAKNSSLYVLSQL